MDRQAQRVPDGALVDHERYRPEQTTLYRQVQQHVVTFSEQAASAAGAQRLQFVKDEFDAFLAWLAERCESATARIVVLELTMVEEILRWPLPHWTHHIEAAHQGRTTRRCCRCPS